MALLAVVEHPKFHRLMNVLGLSRFEALGVLETLWHFTHKNAPQGNIGRFDDEEIADWIGWKGDHKTLFAALIKTKWVDKCKENRLVVHDWSTHCSDATKLALRRKGLDFVSVTTVSGQSRDTEGTPKEEPQKSETAVFEPGVPTESGQCGDSVGTYPVPVPVPVPGPVPVPDAGVSGTHQEPPPENERCSPLAADYLLEDDTGRRTEPVPLKVFISPPTNGQPPTERDADPGKWEQIEAAKAGRTR